MSCSLHTVVVKRERKCRTYKTLELVFDTKYSFSCELFIQRLHLGTLQPSPLILLTIDCTVPNPVWLSWFPWVQWSICALHPVHQQFATSAAQQVHVQVQSCHWHLCLPKSVQRGPPLVLVNSGMLTVYHSCKSSCDCQSPQWQRPESNNVNQNILGHVPHLAPRESTQSKCTFKYKVITDICALCLHKSVQHGPPLVRPIPEYSQYITVANYPVTASLHSGKTGKQHCQSWEHPDPGLSALWM
jgi:hypothetical protein